MALALEPGGAGEAPADRPGQAAPGLDLPIGGYRRDAGDKEDADQRRDRNLFDNRRARLSVASESHAATLERWDAGMARSVCQLRACGVATLLTCREMEGSPFNLFGDPDEFRARMEELSEQMQSSQRVAWADNAIKLAVEMTVASIGQLDLSGTPDEQSMQVRDAIRVLFPDAVTLVREAREGLS
jgi:hypothetical protein